MVNDNFKYTNSKSLLFRQLSWNDIDPIYLQQLILLAKEEDFEGSGLATLPKVVGDVSTNSLNLNDNLESEASIVANSELIIAGLPLVPIVLNTYGDGCIFNQRVREGSRVAKNEILASITGPANTILQAERVLLNFIQHLSGIATLTSDFVAALGNSKTRLLDTRKTTPGFRVLEKYAVARGGAWNHRMGLFHWVLLKDNHLAVSGVNAGHALTELISRVRKNSKNLIIEVEVDNLEQIDPVLEAGTDIILFDNFSVTQLDEAVKIVGDRAIKEASGGIFFEKLPQISNLGLDFISLGALTYQSTWMDISLDWKLI